MQTKNPFTLISAMNSAFGNKMGDINNPNWEAIDRQMKIIESEFNELRDAVAARDMRLIRDGVGDVTVTNLGLAHIVGFDHDADQVRIFESNMSKFCANDSELHASMQKYAGIGVEVYAEGEFPQKCLKSAKDQTGTNGEFYKKGKFLKGINFKEPVFE